MLTSKRGSVVPDQHSVSTPSASGSRTTGPVRKQSDPLAALRHLALIANRTTDQPQIVQAAITAMHMILPADDAAVYLGNTRAGRCTRLAPPLPVLPDIAGYERLAHHIFDQLVAQNTPLILSDLGDASVALLTRLTLTTTRALAAFPLTAGDRVIGMLWINQEQPYSFTPDEVAALDTLAVQLGTILSRLTPAGEDSSSASMYAQRLEAIIQGTGDAVLIIDAHDCVIALNPAARVLFGWLPEEAEGRLFGDISFPPELRAGLFDVLYHSAGGQTTFDVQLHDGQSLSVTLIAINQRSSLDALEQPGGWVLVIRDMTRLRDAERARLNFIHSAAHDLRNPLGVTLGALSMLNKDLRQTGTDMQREVIQIGLMGIERMEKMINGLLHLEHIEGEASLQQTLVDVRDLVERVIIDVRPAIDNRAQTLIIELPPAIPLIQGNIHWLTRALGHVLANANQFTPPDGTITLRVSAEDTTIYIEVEDTGPGIPPEAQGRIFDPFIHSQHANPTLDPDGIGLGLTIVKSVIERHQGRIFVKSRPGEGTIVGIILPIAETV